MLITVSLISSGLESVVLMTGDFFVLGFLVVILFVKKNKNKSHIKISQNQTSKKFETKSKNTFLYPEQHLGNLEQGKVYNSETFPTYNKDNCKVGEFTIIDKKK